MKSHWFMALAAGVLAALALEGCVTAESPPRFADVRSATMTGGTFVNLQNLRNMNPGLTKDQVYDLLGPPHFSEGIIGVHVWNYLFDFRRDGQVVSCQYQVQFDKHMRVSNTYWRESSCADFVQPTAAKALASKEAQTPTLEHFTLASDVLFAFGKSSLGSMLPAGKASLDKAIRRIKRHRDVTEIRVVGHTDRIGPASENEPLSLARAESVREYLVARGLDSRLVHTEGAGSREPISHCPPGRNSSVIACLQPDRRVTITVKGRN